MVSNPETTDRRHRREWLHARLRLGARRVERLRQDIAAQAGLPTLPSVEIVPEVWRVDGDLVLGRTGVVERDGELHLGVLLPAASAVQSDDNLLRRILLIRFRDCISRMVRTATQDPSVRRPTSLVDPTFWFGSDDAARLRSWKEHRIVGMEILADFLSKSLPVVAPPPEDVAQDFNVPDWVLDRLDDSSVERAPTAPGSRL